MNLVQQKTQTLTLPKIRALHASKALYLCQVLCFLSFILIAEESLAWGKRGHQIVGETSALLISLEPTGEFFDSRQFDFGYYNNVPDFIWKRPETYEKERHEHYLNLEIFKRSVEKQKDLNLPQVFELSRKQFNGTFKDVPSGAGRAIWRVRELDEQLTLITQRLKAFSGKNKKQKQDLQKQWLSLAGPMGHYVADLSQPLHVTENHDGQLTDQKGLHQFFETNLVDELYPDLLGEVRIKVLRDWPSFKKKNQSKALSLLLLELTEDSYKSLKTVLETDKKYKRSRLKEAAGANKEVIVERLARGALTLAEIYRRQIGWSFDGRQFYYFAAEPDFIAPPE